MLGSHASELAGLGAVAALVYNASAAQLQPSSLHAHVRAHSASRWARAQRAALSRWGDDDGGRGAQGGSGQGSDDAPAALPLAAASGREGALAALEASGSQWREHGKQPHKQPQQHGVQQCFDLQAEYVQCADQTGCGLGDTARAWDYQVGD